MEQQQHQALLQHQAAVALDLVKSLSPAALQLLQHMHDISQDLLQELKSKDKHLKVGVLVCDV